MIDGSTNFIGLSSSIVVVRFNAIKYNGFIVGDFAIKKSDESVFGTSRESVGIIKAPYRPRYDLTICVPGSSIVNGFTDTAGNILILGSGQVYIDKITGFTGAKVYEITFQYPLKK